MAEVEITQNKALGTWAKSKKFPREKKFYLCIVDVQQQPDYNKCVWDSTQMMKATELCCIRSFCSSQRFNFGDLLTWVWTSEGPVQYLRLQEQIPHITVVLLVCSLHHLLAGSHFTECGIKRIFFRFLLDSLCFTDIDVPFYLVQSTGCFLLVWWSQVNSLFHYRSNMFTWIVSATHLLCLVSENKKKKFKHGTQSASLCLCDMWQQEKDIYN